MKRAGEVCGFAAKEYAAKVKVAKLGAECEAAGLGLVPMVVETFGRWAQHIHYPNSRNAMIVSRTLCVRV